MKLLRAATLSVRNLAEAVDNYCEWLDYSVEEQGSVDPALAASWGTPGAAGRPYSVLRPASGRDVFLRNEGGRFVDATDEAGLGCELWGAGAVFGDANRDGNAGCCCPFT